MLTLSSLAQIDDNILRQQVLEKGIIDSSFIFGKWTKEGQTETHLKYLGQVTTTDGHVWKLMNSSCFWGLSHHATTKILVYNVKNEYVGNYHLGMIYDLPDKLENGKLIFTNYGKKDCDQKHITKVDFTRGCPKDMFIKCKGEYGDSYIFTFE